MLSELFQYRGKCKLCRPVPEVKYFGADEMIHSQTSEFMTWYDRQKDDLFDNRRFLEQYYQDEVTAELQACQIFGREFIGIGNI